MSKFRRAGRIKAGVVGTAALSMAAVVGGVSAVQPAALSMAPVDLTALIVVGSSTNPNGSGTASFFGGLFNQAPYNPGGQPGPDLVGVPFGAGPRAIDAALQANTGEPNAVLSSGWGAANASLVLSRLDRNQDAVLPSTVFVLDNNVSRPDGGFGTRYPWFSLIGVNPFPSPTDTTAAAVVDTAYQYNYNSNAPADLLNVVAHVNSLVAYLYGYREQDQIALPVDVDGRPTVSCGGANTCAVLSSGAEALPCNDARCDTPEGDRVVAYVTTRGNTTYVTYTVDELPLARLIRDVVPFGNTIADVTEPVLKVIVDSAYYDNNPIPSDPSRYRPARLAPTPAEFVDTVSKVPGAIGEGLKTLNRGPDKKTEPADDSAEEDTPTLSRRELRMEKLRERASDRDRDAEVETESKDSAPQQDPAKETAKESAADTSDTGGDGTAAD
jgi:hypothetical protein